jgi:hypothetical protein
VKSGAPRENFRINRQKVLCLSIVANLPPLIRRKLFIQAEVYLVSGEAMLRVCDKLVKIISHV